MEGCVPSTSFAAAGRRECLSDTHFLFSETYALRIG